MTSREFNQNTGEAKKAAASGPVYITDRGELSHVLMTIDDFERLSGSRTIADLLSEPSSAGEIEFDVPISIETARPANFG